MYVCMYVCMWCSRGNLVETCTTQWCEEACMEEGHTVEGMHMWVPHNIYIYIFFLVFLVRSFKKNKHGGQYAFICCTVCCMLPVSCMYRNTSRFFIYYMYTTNLRSIVLLTQTSTRFPRESPSTFRKKKSTHD